MSCLQDIPETLRFSLVVLPSAGLRAATSRSSTATGCGGLARDGQCRGVASELGDHPVDFGEDRTGDDPCTGLVHPRRLRSDSPRPGGRVQRGVHARGVSLQSFACAR